MTPKTAPRAAAPAAAQLGEARSAQLAAPLRVRSTAAALDRSVAAVVVVVAAHGRVPPAFPRRYSTAARTLAMAR